MSPEALDGTLRALADPVRRGVIDRLRRRPAPAGELALALEVSPPSMSRHLRLLRRRGLVEEVRDDADARLRIYRLRREPFDDLRDWLAKVESFWDDQLESYRAHVERSKKGRPR